MKTGIVAALPQEMATIVQPIPSPGVVVSPRDNLFCILSGVGARCAFESARKLLERGIDRLVSWGCAGALAPDLCSGDLLLPEVVIASNHRKWTLDEDWRMELMLQVGESCRLWQGSLYTSESPVTTKSARKRLYEETGAIAVDLESSAIAEFAGRKGIPVVVLRAVADSCETGIPGFIRDSIGKDGTIDGRAFFQKLLVRPSEWAKTIRMVREFRASCSTLSLIAQKLD